MSFGGNQGGEGGNVWSSGSHGGSRGDFSRSYDDDDGQGSRDSRPYRGSYGNSYSRGGGSGGSGGGGSYGFRRDRDNDRQTEIQRDTIFIQDLPKDVTKEQLQDAFSGVGRIKIDDRSGGPKVWLYKDRVTDEGNGRATVTYEDEETATRAISEYNDQHIDSLGVTVRVQQAQRRLRTNDRGGFGGGSGGGRGYRGGRSGWDSNNSRSGGGFSSDGNRWGGSRGGGSSSGGFSDSRGGGYRSQGGYGGGGGDSYRSSDDRDGSYRGGSQHRGASRGRGGYSNYSPY